MILLQVLQLLLLLHQFFDRLLFRACIATLFFVNTHRFPPSLTFSHGSHNPCGVGDQQSHPPGKYGAGLGGLYIPHP